uniref:Ovule protein n=1 Tax=Heterorhabditis bacteriophora TaxID=37862 RepID=A0A1I7WT55_HETBA
MMERSLSYVYRRVGDSLMVRYMLSRIEDLDFEAVPHSLYFRWHIVCNILQGSHDRIDNNVGVILIKIGIL